MKLKFVDSGFFPNRSFHNSRASESVDRRTLYILRLGRDADLQLRLNVISEFPLDAYTKVNASPHFQIRISGYFTPWKAY